MAPTRELVAQISKEVKRLGRAVALSSVAVFGGSGVANQISELKRGTEVVVATPGRLIDLLVSGGGKITNMRRVTYLVMDEADRMFDMGFEPQIMRIVGNIRPDRQTVMFSATFPRSVETLARQVLQDPVEIQVGGRSVVNADIAQFVELRPEGDRFLRLLEILGEWYEAGKIIVFVHSQDKCDNLFRDLLKAGYPCLSLHGGKEQSDRECTIADFKGAVCNILVATSVAARGLDVRELVLVVNYDVPNHHEDYVHRVGRTGRAGNKGTAITFIGPDEERYAPDLVKALKESSAAVPQDLQALADAFQAKRKAGLVQGHGSGYGGSGYKFDKSEDAKIKAARKSKAKEFGIVDDEEDGEGKAAEDSDDDIRPANQPSAAATAAAAAGAAAAGAAAAAAAANGVSIGGGTPVAAAQAAAAAQQQQRNTGFEAEMEINDFPQNARWKVTHKGFQAEITELTGAAVTTKGIYVKSGEPPEGERKLFLLIEGPTEGQVRRAKQEIRRVIEEHVEKAMRRDTGAGGRYTIMRNQAGALAAYSAPFIGLSGRRPHACSSSAAAHVRTAMSQAAAVGDSSMYLRRPQGQGRWASLLFPFTGGNRHIVLQLMSWILWGFSLLMFLPVLLALMPGSYSMSKDLPTIPHTHVDMVSGAAAAVSFIGELLMIKAILVFDERRLPAGKGGSATPLHQALTLRPVLASALVVVLGLLLSVTGFLLLMALEYLPDLPSRVLYCCLSLSCFLIASSTTYGLGGFLRYGSSGSSSGSDGKAASGGDDGMWQFFQPFSGGTAFVATQAVSWSMFAATVVLLAVMMQQLVAGVAYCFRCWAIGAGTLMVLAQAMLGLSLLFFRSPKSTAARLMRAASGAITATISSNGGGSSNSSLPKQGWIGANLPIILMYSPVHVFFSAWVLSYVFLPLHVALAGWVAFLVPYYGFTQGGRPAHTGCRQWPWLMAWFADNIEGALQAWFGSLTVVYDGDAAAAALAAAAAAADTSTTTTLEKQGADLQQQQGVDGDSASDESAPECCGGGSSSSSDSLQTQAQQQQQQGTDEQQDKQEEAKQRYIFGFQPHGLYPTGAGFLPWMPSFKQHFPGVNPVTLTATVIFFPPFIRDICCWAGFRQVSKRTFLSALAERGAVMFCPGGQAELVHAWRSFLPEGQRQLVLQTRHKGFCRIAIEQQAALVPVLALGESLQLANALNLPSLQQYTYRKLGFPVPFILRGRWGLSPFPRKVPLVYVIGKPLVPPPHAGQPVAAADVDALHAAYYGALEDLYARYHHLHPAFKGAQLVLTEH
ncbi:hypothetical protein OEZ86_010685 [Tetradesmus obliquus]|nr:hypothetical protein OEZ86_010685 [Tetradesmus obliquus]